MVVYCVMSILVVANPLRHRDLKMFSIFLVTEALLHCREAQQLSRAQLWLITKCRCHLAEVERGLAPARTLLAALFTAPVTSMLFRF